MPNLLPSGSSAPAEAGLLPEIQALRAVAVMLVLLYHLWPDAVPGGYVGVDVFFVISGFLITGHIARDLASGKFGLKRFYLRRARRLLPASLLVLLTTSVVAFLVLPRTQWIETARQVLSSTFYVQNWMLASADIDYLSPTTTPSVVQHFWSLSVEEQFYLVLPVLLLLMARITGRSPARRHRAILVLLAGIVGVSFVYSLWQTANNPAGSYFFSTTRAWEFAAGGLLAVALRRTSRGAIARAALSWAGLAAIAASAMMFSLRTPFPGWAAVLPVAGTLAIIGAGMVESAWSPAYLLRFGPVQFLGNVSYSLYLWHWPLIMLWPAVTGIRLSTNAKLVILAMSVVLALITKVLVEDRFRTPAASGAEPLGPSPVRGRAWRAPVSPYAAFLAVSMSAIVLVSGWAWRDVQAEIDYSRVQVARALSEGLACFGAAAMVTRDDCEADRGSDRALGDLVVPSPANAVGDLRASKVWNGCLAEIEDDDPVRCSFGPKDATVHVVLFGDSHALQWFPAIEEIAKTKGWRLDTYLRSACTPNLEVMSRSNEQEQARCHRWATTGIKEIAADTSIDLVITTAMSNKRWEPVAPLDAYDTGVAGFERAWARFVKGGRRSVLVLRDTPRPQAGILDCVSGAEWRKCRTARDLAMRRSPWPERPDPLVAAVEKADNPRIRLLDMTRYICTPKRCPAVIGNVLVFADGNHLTIVYARTLVPYLSAPLVAALPREAAGS
jgi:peptidoglycan/LPS O-acetylase OafA/YrhL